MARPSPAADVQGLVTRLMQADFAAAHAVWVEGHLHILSGLRRLFGNDMDKIMVLAVIGQQMMKDPGMTGLPPHRGDVVFPPIASSRLTNVGSIATAVGIPRESVRRKVNELVAAGWVVRDEAGHLAVAPQAAADLSPATLDAITMLDGLFGHYLTMMIDKGLIDMVVPPDQAAPQGITTPVGGARHSG